MSALCNLPRRDTGLREEDYVAAISLAWRARQIGSSRPDL